MDDGVLRWKGKKGKGDDVGAGILGVCFSLSQLEKTTNLDDLKIPSGKRR